MPNNNNSSNLNTGQESDSPDHDVPGGRHSSGKALKPSKTKEDFKRHGSSSVYSSGAGAESSATPARAKSFKERASSRSSRKAPQESKSDSADGGGTSGDNSGPGTSGNSNLIKKKDSRGDLAVENSYSSGTGIGDSGTGGGDTAGAEDSGGPTGADESEEEDGAGGFMHYPERESYGQRSS